MHNFYGIAVVLQGTHSSSDLLHKRCEILTPVFANKSVTTTEKLRINYSKSQQSIEAEVGHFSVF